MQEIESYVKSSLPKEVHVQIFDGGLLLHVLGYIPHNFGLLARKILIKACSYNSKPVYIVFDKYIEHSNKNPERDF